MKSYSIQNNKIHYCITLIIFFISVGVSLDSYSQKWVVSYGGTQTDEGRSVFIDQDDNIYITGFFQGCAFFGGIELVSKGDTDIFLAKLNQNGKLLWVRQFGSGIKKNMIATEIGYALCTDADGNIYLSGIFSHSADFGDTTLNSLGGDDIFVAKFNGNGHILWARSIGSGGHDIPYDICLTNDGSIVLCGVFGQDPEDKAHKTHLEGSVSFVGQIDHSGEMKIIRAYNGLGNVGSRAVAVDKNNNIYWGIDFMEKVRTPARSILSNGNYNILLEKISPSGELLWQKSIGGNYDDRISSLSILNNNDLLLAGSFEDKITIDGKTLISKGNSDFLICEFDESGNVIWLERLGGTSVDKAVSIASTVSGDIIVGGNFQGTIVAGNDTLISAGYNDAVVVSYSKNRVLQWAKQSGNKHYDNLYSVAIGNKFICFTGGFRGNLEINDAVINSVGSSDIIIATLPLSVANKEVLACSFPAEEQHISFMIFPNPSNGLFHIAHDNKESIIVDLKVSDLAGNAVFQIDKKMLPSTINLSFLSNGAYFIYFNYNGETIVDKVIVKH